MRQNHSSACSRLIARMGGKRITLAPFGGGERARQIRGQIIHRNRRNPLQKRLWAEELSYLQPEWHSPQIGNEAEIHTGQIIHSLKSHRDASYFKRSSTSDQNVTARTGDMQRKRWRILCQRAAKEQDLERLLQLVREMNRLLIKRLLQADVSTAAAGRNRRGMIATS